MRYQGKIADWKDDKGFGFITPNGGGERVFIHIKSFSNRQMRPAGNELVTYELTHDAKGRPQAGSVAFVGRQAAPPGPRGRSTFPLILAAAFLALVAALVLAGKLPAAVAGIYLVASLVAFVAYALDKSAARNGQRRTPESTLHLFALAGGWPGALLAQRLLRHKSSKQSFQFVFWVTVVLNGCALAWFHSSSGAEALRSMLGAT
ncbi:MAG: DNA-binding protein [Hydrogenophilales bacterium 17-64-11]|nr:MAG: DNA-binding protein [Hydrogenophilales bacterium 17-64-11]